MFQRLGYQEYPMSVLISLLFSIGPSLWYSVFHVHIWLEQQNHLYNVKHIIKVLIYPEIWHSWCPTCVCSKRSARQMCAGSLASGWWTVWAKRCNPRPEPWFMIMPVLMGCSGRCLWFSHHWMKGKMSAILDMDEMRAKVWEKMSMVSYFFMGGRSNYITTVPLALHVLQLHFNQWNHLVLPDSEVLADQ